MGGVWSYPDGEGGPGDSGGSAGAHSDGCSLPQARASMQAEMVLKEAEAERQRKRILELEEMQRRLQEALQQEVKARQDEEAVRYAQARWVPGCAGDIPGRGKDGGLCGDILTSCSLLTGYWLRKRRS